MSLDVKKVGVFTRRVFIVGYTAKYQHYFIIFGRLFHLQVFAHRKYLDKSTNNYTKSFVVPPQRGNILDINGEKLHTTLNIGVLSSKERGRRMLMFYIVQY
jgi:cell division protein FtsI/penicillin-binding protein 2